MSAFRSTEPVSRLQTLGFSYESHHKAPLWVLKGESNETVVAGGLIAFAESFTHS